MIYRFSEPQYWLSKCEFLDSPHTLPRLHWACYRNWWEPWPLSLRTILDIKYKLLVVFLPDPKIFSYLPQLLTRRLPTPIQVFEIFLAFDTVSGVMTLLAIVVASDLTCVFFQAIFWQTWSSNCYFSSGRGVILNIPYLLSVTIHFLLFVFLGLFWRFHTFGKIDAILWLFYLGVLVSMFFCK